MEELAYSWPACFENLSLSLLYSSPCLSVQDGFRGKNTPSDLTLSGWHSQAVKLTANGVWPSKWTGYNKPLTQGSPYVTGYVSAHSYTRIEKHTHQKDNAPHILSLLNTHTLTHRHRPSLASSHFSPLAGLNPAKPQPCIWPASHLSCKRASAGRRSWWAPGCPLLRQEQLWISDLNLSSYEVNIILKCMGIIPLLHGQLPS